MSRRATVEDYVEEDDDDEDDEDDYLNWDGEEDNDVGQVGTHCTHTPRCPPPSENVRRAYHPVINGALFFVHISSLTIMYSRPTM